MGQCVGEEIFVRGALVKVYAFTLATVFAKAVVVAFFALFFNAQTFLNKLDCLGATLKFRKVGVKDIAKGVFVSAVEVAGINLAVCLDDVLMGAVSVHTALLSAL